MADPHLLMFLALEIQEGKDPMKKKGPDHLGSTAACTYRLVQMTKSSDEARCLVLSDSWFGTYDCAVATKCELKQEAIYVIKTGHRKTPKKPLDAIMKHFPAGSYKVVPSSSSPAVSAITNPSFGESIEVTSGVIVATPPNARKFHWTFSRSTGKNESS